MRYFFVAIIFLLLPQLRGVCQAVKVKQSRFFNITEIGYGNGIGKINFEKIGYKIENESHFVRVRTEFGYFITKKLSLGLGFGLDGYHDYTFNTAPLFVDTRFYFKTQPQTFFVFSNIGYAIPLAGNFEKGFIGGVSFGRKISMRRVILLPSIGINLQRLNDIGYYSFGQNQAGSYSDNITNTSLQFNLGLLF